ncbi:melanoma-associated antigen B3-like [Heterocephalus glaber]|nr:melanoma-associated antigen B3-like [Heterocephalus glaber]
MRGSSRAALFNNYYWGNPHGPVEMLERFILHKFNLKQLFTKDEMLKVTTWKNRDEFVEIFKSACGHLEAGFAVEGREVDSTHHSYILASMLSLPNNGRILPGRGYPKTGLLMNVLAVIFMKGNCVAKEDIWRFLKKMGMYPGRKHLVFGDPKKLFTQNLVRLKYLVYQQVPGSDPPCHEFLWGPEAHTETNKLKVLKFLSRVNKASLAYFSSLYEISKRDEVERAQTTGAAKDGCTAKPSAVSMATDPTASSSPVDV